MPHNHEHDEDHFHEDHPHQHDHPIEIRVEQDILGKNNLLAERNRGYFQAKKILALNLVSSPGSGKTTLLERTIKEMGKRMRTSVIEGDQQTMLDAERIQLAGAPVVQINTGNGCHLDADMVNKAVNRLMPAENSLLFIENVGNLVCPALFDLGENQRIVIISVTEGEDKPLKYPAMFRTSSLCIINKTDLLPFVDFRTETFKTYARQVSPHIRFMELSAKSGQGMQEWYSWLENQFAG
jgi:hydrogenase nickel incorporation protein HypB